MSRDMQIGLLLAVGFLALVGGVLFYRIEHPDELEQFLNGGETQAAATSTAPAPDTSKPDVPPGNHPGTGASGGTAVAANTAVPPAPVNNPPAFETALPGAPVITTPPAPTTTANNVVQTAAPTTAPSAGNGVKPPIVPVAAAGGALALGALGSDKKNESMSPPSSAAVEQNKPGASATSRASMPMEPPGLGAPPTPPVATAAPAIALDLTPKTTTPPAATDNKKPSDLVIKPEATASNVPPAGATPPSMSPPAMSPPSATGSNLPTPPVGAAIVMSDPPKPATTPEKKSDELPQPPIVTPPSNGGITFDTTKPAPPAGMTPPPMTNPATTTPPPATAAPVLGGTPPMNSPLDTTITPSNPPSTVTPQNTHPAPTTDGDSFRTGAPKAGLGKPMPESEVALREKRWGESAGTPAPIIPSSVDSRTNNNVVPAATTGRRAAVVQDTYMPTERAVPGETFSTLSQRLYGDTNYAVALAAFNKEEGFVKLDQPTPGELVAKPNREILDQKYPQYVRRLTPANLNQTSATMMANNANAPAKNGAAPPAATGPLPTYRVGKGEQLFEVAKKTLGDGYRWSEIYALNKDMLRDSTELRPDMVLKLPAEAKK